MKYFIIGVIALLLVSCNDGVVKAQPSLLDDGAVGYIFVDNTVWNANPESSRIEEIRKTFKFDYAFRLSNGNIFLVRTKE